MVRTKMTHRQIRAQRLIQLSALAKSQDTRLAERAILFQQRQEKARRDAARLKRIALNKERIEKTAEQGGSLAEAIDLCSSDDEDDEDDDSLATGSTADSDEISTEVDTSPFVDIDHGVSTIGDGTQVEELPDYIASPLGTTAIKAEDKPLSPVIFPAPHVIETNTANLETPCPLILDNIDGPPSSAWGLHPMHTENKFSDLEFNDE